MRLRGRDAAIDEIRPLYDQAVENSEQSTQARTGLFQRIAGVRERMWLLDEARAWHQLILLDDPANEVSVRALARLGNENKVGAL